MTAWRDDHTGSEGHQSPRSREVEPLEVSEIFQISELNRTEQCPPQPSAIVTTVCQWCNSCMQWVGEQWPKSLYVRVFFMWTKRHRTPSSWCSTTSISPSLCHNYYCITLQTLVRQRQQHATKMDNCMSLKFREFRGRRRRPKSYLDRALKFREVRVCHAWTVEVLVRQSSEIQRGRHGRQMSYLDRALKLRELTACHGW